MVINIKPSCDRFLTLEFHGRSDDVVRDNLWRRLHTSFNYGDVLITVGTGKLTQSEEKGMGLVGEHDYTILDVKECEDQRSFLIKNPWSEGTIWKGNPTRSNTVARLGKDLEDIDISDAANPSGTREDPLPAGTFWMGLNDVFQSFESIYLNWNPSLFSYREDVHFTWDLSSCSSIEGTFASNPQYAVSSKKAGTVWLLLNRHFTSKVSLSKRDQKGSSSVESEPGFISLHAFHNNGKREFLSEGADVRGPYVDSPNTLLKLELPAASTSTIVVSEQALPRSVQTFTLSAFSLAPLSITQARDEHDHSTVLQGTWTASTAGGNASDLSYRTNPHFSVRLSQVSDLSLLLENPVERHPLHLKLMWGNGKQIHSVTSRDIVGDSAEHRKGFAFVKVHDVQAGLYNIVCSTFETGQFGDFTLRVNSTAPCIVSKIAVEAAGRFTTKAPTAVFTPGISQMLSPLTTQRLNRLSLRARSSGDSSGSQRSTCSPLRLSLEYGQGPSKDILGSSDEDAYLDGYMGVQTNEVDIQRRMCAEKGVWVVIERLANPGLQSDEFVHVELLSDGPLEVGEWRIGQA